MSRRNRNKNRNRNKRNSISYNYYGNTKSSYYGGFHQATSNDIDKIALEIFGGSYYKHEQSE